MDKILFCPYFMIKRLQDYKIKIMTEKATPAKRAKLALNVLQKRYPSPQTQLEYSNSWELLVATILAAQCTDARVNLVTPIFFNNWPGPAELALATQEEVEKVIHSTGFFRNKAKNLLACARMAHKEYNDNLPDNMQELIKFPGVARKTANVVLYGAYGINAGLAVDTHVKRISYRLGLTENIDPDLVEKDLMALFPQSEWGNVNLRMVWFGREVCRSRGPNCESCEMNNFCPKNDPPVKAGAAKQDKRGAK